MLCSGALRFAVVQRHVLSKELGGLAARLSVQHGGRLAALPAVRRVGAGRLWRAVGSGSLVLAGSLLLASDEADGQEKAAAGVDEQTELVPSFAEMFHENHRWTVYEVGKTVFNTVFVLPLRVALIAGCFAVGWLLARLVSIGHRFDWTEQERLAHPDGLPARRPLARWRLRVFAPAVSLLSRIITLAGGFWVRTSGPVPTQDSVAPVVVCNHVSLVDALFFLPYFICSPVSKSTNAQVPLLSAILLAMQTVLVDRGSGDSRKAAREEIVRRAQLHHDDSALGFPPTLIFPEGTTSSGAGLLEFKTGAFAPGLPVQPVVLRYRWEQCNPAFVGSALTAMFRTLTQFVNYVDVEFLPVYVPSPQEVADPELFAENVRSQMAAALGRPKAPFYFDNEASCCRETRSRFN